MKIKISDCIVVNRDDVFKFAENVIEYSNGFYALDDAQNVIKTNLAKYDSDLHTWNYEVDAIVFNIWDNAISFDGKTYIVKD
jgi:hypothetical protein